MKNKEKWHESKYHFDSSGKITASNNRKYLSPSSWLIANIVAKMYEKNLPIYTKGLLLDLGCGNVPLYGAYRDYVSDSICVDWDNTMHKNPHLDISQDISQELPFENATFDTIILSDVLEHVYNPSHLFDEMKRILKENGIIIMNVPYCYQIHEQPFDYYRYTEYFYRSIIREKGLSLLLIEEIGGIVETMSDICGKMLGYCKCLFPLLYLHERISYSFYTSKIGQKIYHVTRKQLTLGYFLVIKKDDVCSGYNADISPQL